MSSSSHQSASSAPSFPMPTYYDPAPPTYGTADGRMIRAEHAMETLKILDQGQYKAANGVEYLLGKANKRLISDTKLYLSDYNVKNPITVASTAAVPVQIRERSTIAAVRELASEYQHVGVLSFASPSQPGGGFKQGAQAQEESLVRASNLFIGLSQKSVAPFYEALQSDIMAGTFSRAMIYSKEVTFIRDGNDNLASPIYVDVLTCSAVDARRARAAAKKTPGVDVEKAIRDSMRDRMERILYLFAEKGAKVLVLGAFGTGRFENSVETVATLWAELLGIGGSLARVFDLVEFAIVGASTYRKFRETYEAVIAQQQNDMNSGWR